MKDRSMMHPSTSLLYSLLLVIIPSLFQCNHVTAFTVTNSNNRRFELIPGTTVTKFGHLQKHPLTVQYIVATGSRGKAAMTHEQDLELTRQIIANHANDSKVQLVNSVDKNGEVELDTLVSVNGVKATNDKKMMSKTSIVKGSAAALVIISLIAKLVRVSAGMA